MQHEKRAGNEGQPQMQNQKSEAMSNNLDIMRMHVLIVNVVAEVLKEICKFTQSFLWFPFQLVPEKAIHHQLGRIVELHMPSSAACPVMESRINELLAPVPTG